MASRNDIEESVRQTVQVRGETRTKVPRNHTAQGGVQTLPSRGTAAARSQSQDSILKAAAAVEKAKGSGKRPKKSSQHADVIDKLDFTGVGPMFHHDGPFDACAPSRNRSRAKAPMLAWSGANPNDTRALAGNDGPYGAAALSSAFSDTYPPDPPRRKVDAIAESWGKHEPEPFEEFSAGGGTRNPTPASSIYNGRTANTSTTTTNSTRSAAKPSRSAHKDGLAREGRRAALPPPQPIFVPDNEIDPDLPLAQPSPGGGPKRSKSLMQRIRKMRDAPNMPVEEPISAANPDGARPTHRSQSSFLGRFGGASGRAQQGLGATSLGSENSDAFVYIDDPRGAQDKDLPPPPQSSTTPKDSEVSDYFEPQSSHGAASPGTPAGGLGRKQSLMKKVGRAVTGRGNK